MITKKDLDTIDGLIKKYSILEIKKSFIKQDVSIEIKNAEIEILIKYAMILSNSNKVSNKNRILKIATIIPQISTKEEYILSCRILLSKLKNYPMISILDNNSNNNCNLNVFLQLKDIYQRENNTIYIDNENTALMSDAQFNIYQIYENYRNLSISAPTSMGKSYLFVRLMIKELIKTKKCIVYVVPTRALINEVVWDVRKCLNAIENHNFFITSSSDTSNIPEGSVGIFVLTQERLYQLCNSKDLNIGTIIIDEAQSIMDSKRGILLEYSVRYAKHIWCNVRIIFISPFVENPEVLLEKFSANENSKSYNERQITVRKNIIKLKKAPRGYNSYYDDELVADLRHIKRSGNIPCKILDVYQNFNNGENSIIYCNKPSMCINVCEEIINRKIFEITTDQELLDLADFIEKYIHKKYSLTKYIRYGIVFHYSSLPGFIRVAIEEQAKKGKFKLVVCTPTLLQGVNIPIQNIYILNPLKNNEDLSDLDFWNLIGRAGRLSYDMSGNVILIDSDNWEDINKYDKKKIYISCATQLDEKKSKVTRDNILKDKPITDEEDIYIEGAMLFDSVYRKRHNIQFQGISNEDENEINSKIELVVKEFIPNKDLLVKLLGIRYKQIENLWIYFESIDTQIESMIIPHPLNEDSEVFHNKYKKVINIVNEHFFNYDYSDKQVQRLMYISLSWIREKPLREIIFYKFNSSNEVEISNQVKAQIDEVNNTIRYKLVQGFYAFQEVLKEYLIATNREQLVEKLVNISMFLEFGACKDITVELIAIGISREIAIDIEKGFSKVIDIKDVKTSLKKIDITKIESRYVQNKISEIIQNL